ncbi:hypothetical protein M569_07325, partial [Genlisea aurea]
MGVYLSTPKTEKFSEDGGNDRLRYGLSSMQGWRSTMEDAHAAFTDLDGTTSFFGVYDGHGGKEVARFCAKFLHEQVLRHEAYGAGDLESSLRHAFLRVDEMMCEKSGQKELKLLRIAAHQSSSTDSRFGAANDQEDDLPDEGISYDYKGPSSGSTACVAVFRNNQITVANAGDSRCVLSRKGKAYDLSKDHKPHLAVEKKRILEAGGFIQFGRVNGSLNLARAIGDMELKQNKSLPAEKQIVTADPDIVTVGLTEDDDFVIIACDGIWDCMSSQQVVDLVRDELIKNAKASVVCERVLDRCLAPCSGQEGCDNMTMILVLLKNTLPPPSTT